MFLVNASQRKNKKNKDKEDSSSLNAVEKEIADAVQGIMKDSYDDLQLRMSSLDLGRNSIIIQEPKPIHRHSLKQEIEQTRGKPLTPAESHWIQQSLEYRKQRRRSRELRKQQQRRQQEQQQEQPLQVEDTSFTPKLMIAGSQRSTASGFGVEVLDDKQQEHSSSLVALDMKDDETIVRNNSGRTDRRGPPERQESLLNDETRCDIDNTAFVAFDQDVPPTLMTNRSFLSVKRGSDQLRSNLTFVVPDDELDELVKGLSPSGRQVKRMRSGLSATERRDREVLQNKQSQDDLLRPNLMICVRDRSSASRCDIEVQDEEPLVFESTIPPRWISKPEENVKQEQAPPSCNSRYNDKPRSKRRPRPPPRKKMEQKSNEQQCARPTLVRCKRETARPKLVRCARLTGGSFRTKMDIDEASTATGCGVEVQTSTFISI